ncbi:hypothetical protein KKA47_02375 [bacterium]|nr:hypothetical protein [bacterium]
MKKQNPDKAKKLEAKGDNLFNKGKHKRALKKYKKALKYNSECSSLYEKLIQAQDQVGGEWGKEEFSESLDWLMKKQEIENPNLKQVHERLTPEWELVSDLIIKLINVKNMEDQDKLIRKIRDFGEAAVQPLIDFILSMKNTSA